MFFATYITIWRSFSSSPFIWYFLGVPRPGAMEPDCLVPGRTFPANPRSSSVQRQPACRHLPRTSHQTKILLSKQNLLFNSSHYSPGMHLPSIDMQQRQRPEKNLKKSCAIFWQCALHFLELVETLKVPVTEFWEIFIHANNPWDQTNWNYDRHCFEEKSHYGEVAIGR